jgi:hypothetical protein
LSVRAVVEPWRIVKKKFSVKRSIEVTFFTINCTVIIEAIVLNWDAAWSP